MVKRFGLVAALLAISLLLVACGSDSTETAKDYMEAVLKGDAAAAQKFACASFQEGTAALATISAGWAEQSRGVRDIDLKYDLGKGNNSKEVLVTGSYDIVQLSATGNVIAGSAQQYELAAVVRDKHDVDGDGDYENRINTRIVLTMEKSGDDWCVADLHGGYFSPEEVEETTE
ncbi:MAG: hypothetical protein KJ047_14365 [Anaerolineae bacterium]|nr:hypothetical protein [Anaerolineae bacterium]MEB2288365.1 hypothetical protein [Anaerolineae bacterium]